jgi:hypothetical protein
MGEERQRLKKIRSSKIILGQTDQKFRRDYGLTLTRLLKNLKDKETMLERMEYLDFVNLEDRDFRLVTELAFETITEKNELVKRYGMERLIGKEHISEMKQALYEDGVYHNK